MKTFHTFFGFLAFIPSLVALAGQPQALDSSRPHSPIVSEIDANPSHPKTELNISTFYVNKTQPTWTWSPDSRDVIRFPKFFVTIGENGSLFFAEKFAATSWTTAQALADGVYTLQVRIYDDNGKLSEPTLVRTIIDTVAPQPPKVTSKLNDKKTPDWAWSPAREDSAQILTYRYELTESSPTSDSPSIKPPLLRDFTAKRSLSGNYLPRGISWKAGQTYYLAVRAVDLAGNVSAGAISEITLPK